MGGNYIMLLYIKQYTIWHYITHCIELLVQYFFENCVIEKLFSLLYTAIFKEYFDLLTSRSSFHVSPCNNYKNLKDFKENYKGYTKSPHLLFLITAINNTKTTAVRTTALGVTET